MSPWVYFCPDHPTLKTQGREAGECGDKSGIKDVFVKSLTLSELECMYIPLRKLNLTEQDTSGLAVRILKGRPCRRGDGRGRSGDIHICVNANAVKD